MTDLGIALPNRRGPRPQTKTILKKFIADKRGLGNRVPYTVLKYHLIMINYKGRGSFTVEESGGD